MCPSPSLSPPRVWPCHCRRFFLLLSPLTGVTSPQAGRPTAQDASYIARGVTPTLPPHVPHQHATLFISTFQHHRDGAPGAQPPSHAA